MDEAWLRAAKRLAIGSSQRYRCCGATPAAVIRNEVDKWSCYCHRCKRHKYERKEFVSLSAPAQPLSIRQLPADTCRLLECDAFIQEQVLSFLVSKGIMPEMINLEDVLWSDELRRFILHLGGGHCMGRTLNPRVIPKWMQVGVARPYAVAGHAGLLPDVLAGGQTYSRIALTEDYLSALKVHYVSKVYAHDDSLIAVSTLGTSLNQSLKIHLIEAGLPVLLMLDADAAGDSGTATMLKELRLFVPVQDKRLLCDPKAALVEDILEKIT